MLLENNSYVRCVFIDFTKAFDMVDHAVLVDNLSRLGVPNLVIKWIVAFVTDRTQATRLHSVMLTLLKMNRSIIQGSGVGPVLFIMFANDLKPIGSMNYILRSTQMTAHFCVLKNRPLLSKTRCRI